MGGRSETTRATGGCVGMNRLALACSRSPCRCRPGLRHGGASASPASSRTAASPTFTSPDPFGADHPAQPARAGRGRAARRPRRRAAAASSASARAPACTPSTPARGGPGRSARRSRRACAARASRSPSAPRRSTARLLSDVGQDLVVDLHDGRDQRRAGPDDAADDGAGSRPAADLGADGRLVGVQLAPCDSSPRPRRAARPSRRAGCARAARPPLAEPSGVQIGSDGPGYVLGVASDRARVRQSVTRPFDPGDRARRRRVAHARSS